MVDTQGAPACDFIPAGHVIANRYKIVRPLGAGGMASVYLADDIVLGEVQVAIKVLRYSTRDREALVSRFLREVRLTHKIHHENVVRTFDIGQDGDTLYYTMEYLAGVTLERWLGPKPLSIPKVLRFCQQLLRGISAIHGVGVIHRDLKPANVLVLDAEQLKITDFGIARAGGSAVTSEAGEIMGTMAYIAPELLLGEKPTVAADYYSFAAIVFQMLTGRAPIEDELPARLLMRKVEEPAPDCRDLRPEAPEWLANSLLDLLDRDPAVRMRALPGFVRALEQHGPKTSSSLYDNVIGGTVSLKDVVDDTPFRTGIVKRLAGTWNVSSGIALFIVAVIAILIANRGVGEYLHLKNLDLLFAARGGQAPHSDVIIVGMDEQSYSNLGVPLTQPWPRALHAKLIDRLARDGAAKIVFDILFVDSSDTESDQALAAAIARVPTVLGAASAFSHRATLNGSFLLEELIRPNERIAAAATGVGIVGLPQSAGRVRSFLVERSELFPDVPALAQAASGMLTGGPVRGDLLNFYGPSRTIPTVSYDMVLSDERPLPKGTFEKKIVFVGLMLRGRTGPSQREAFVTPFDEETFGTELHATATSNLLNSDWIRRIPPLSEGVVGMCVAVAVAYPLLALTGPVAIGLSAAALMSVCIIHLCFFYLHVFVPVLAPLLAGVASALVMRGALPRAGRSGFKRRLG